MGRFGFGACLITALGAERVHDFVRGPQTRRTRSPKKPASDREKPDERRFEPFKPEAVTSTGTVTVGGSGDLLPGDRGYLDRASEGLGRRAARPQGRQGKIRRLRRRVPTPGNPTAEASMFYVAYFKGGGGPATGDVLLQTAVPARRASGCTWVPSAHAGSSRRPTHTRRPRRTPLVNNGSSLLDATDLVFHRRTGHRLQPHRRQGQGEGVLRRRSGWPMHSPSFHLPVPVEIRPLEFTQVSVWRKLRHATLGGARQSAAGGPCD